MADLQSNASPPHMLSPAQAQSTNHQGDRHRVSMSDDTVLMEQILATHSPDGPEVNAKPLLNVVEGILQRAIPGSEGLLDPPSHAHFDAYEGMAKHADFVGMLDNSAYTIQKISCELSCKCSGGSDAHATALAILRTLSSYSWDAKLVLALAAFGVNYGGFWLVAKLYQTNHLAKSIFLLNRLPHDLQHNESLKPRFDALRNLIKEMMDVTKCIVKFTELPTEYINHETPAMSIALTHIPAAVYWTIRSIMVCYSQQININNADTTSITDEAWELLSFKVTSILGLLEEQLALCGAHIGRQRQIEAYETLVHLFETIHSDNMKILRALISANENVFSLFDGSTEKRVNLKELKRKNVLLLISDLDITEKELSILIQIYTDSRDQPNRPESFPEVVWLPVVDRSTPWTEEKQKQLFETVQAMMPWYTVDHLLVLDPAVLKYIKEIWQFKRRPILVVLDPEGRVVNKNALDMMRIWGSSAFPFTSKREDALWKEETWSLELLVEGIDKNIPNWISEGRLICLYGGEDMDWIRKFTLAAEAVSQATGTAIELVYVGKSNPKERVRKNIVCIRDEKLSHFWSDLRSIWFFWMRLESMWHSKMQHGKTIDSDPIMKEILTMLRFDGSEQGWAVISQGSSEMAKAKGETILTSFTEIAKREQHVEPNGFIPALAEYLKNLHTPHHCNRLILPGTNGSVPEMLVCADCGRSMEKYTMYRCCID